MAMEIKPGLPVVNRDVSGSSRNVTSEVASVRKDSASVTLTNEAGDLLVAEDKLALYSAVDEVKVGDLRQRLEEGSFESNPVKIASKLIEQEIDLLSR
tara:strand:+ start:3093 stop:3386 length:294 start_codon:yes stop_codon:yes gene_type:complete